MSVLAMAALVRDAERVNALACGWEREFVYFVSAGRGVKIGWTSNAPEDRMAQIQAHHFETLRLRAVFDGTRELERALHERFAHLRIRGEWFRSTAEVWDLVDDLTVATFGDEMEQVA